MKRITTSKTLKCMFCGVPPSDLSRNVDIKHRGVLTWITDSSHISRQKRSVFRTYVAGNEIVCWCYLTPFMSICSAAHRCVYLNPCREGYTNIYRVIGIMLLAISHCIYQVGDNRITVNTSTVRIFLMSWRQKTRDIYFYVDLSSWYEIWFAIICIDMNVILDLPTTIQQFYRVSIASQWVNTD